LPFRPHEALPRRGVVRAVMPGFGMSYAGKEKR
jgi:hypothetical protein